MGRKKKSDDESDLEWDEDSNISYHTNKTKHLILALMAVILIIVSGGIVYAITSFNQTTPQITTPASPTLKPNCSTLTLNTPGSSINPQQGAFEFDCSGTPALVSDGISATPTFTLPNNLAQCTIGQNTECLTLGISPTTCSAGVSVSVITSGSVAPVPQGSFVYCLIYENSPATGSTYNGFTITWS